eukprot:CAMPEP_0118723704 /NCGR_PEP_ID=MMETSP0800-20121206/32152_1 /TAXON_ID=210618 ORGANISM="Striatella unipunctata, Strain CCMP2910" /NCGR_SAMPLE_ID=MMETSP0800 /ASSEMBLY_ACC=CAM_ASM_000638 /LENGTH=178 /DNA_ID=CAMNT_0006632161 /DNA_START=164 /DNA_END=697 /DNA_ORIENTATION=-
MTAIDCADVFGGFPDALGAHMDAMKGLQLDVERMFTERVQIYPTGFQMKEFTPSAVVAVMLRTAVGAIVEHVRVRSFTTKQYRQLQIDVEFLRQLVPHYVKDEFLADGTNGCKSVHTLLNDVLTKAGERCLDLDVVGTDEFFDESSSQYITPTILLQRFMVSEDSDEIIPRFTIERNH